MKQENLALGVRLGREEGTRPDKPGEIRQAAELGGTGHPALGKVPWLTVAVHVLWGL